MRSAFHHRQQGASWHWVGCSDFLLSWVTQLLYVWEGLPVHTEGCSGCFHQHPGVLVGKELQVAWPQKALGELCPPEETERSSEWPQQNSGLHSVSGRSPGLSSLLLMCSTQLTIPRALFPGGPTPKSIEVPNPFSAGSVTCSL